MSRPRAARTLTCPNCGAPASSDDVRCRYCRSALAAISCGSCFGLLFKGAAFCDHCGSPRNRIESRDAWHAACPGCKGNMAWVKVGGADLLECAGCQGTWVEAQTFERICADREAQAAVVHLPNPESPAGTGAATSFRYRPCPICSKLMNRLNFSRISGAVVDVCKGHGTFLDRGELHQIVRFIQGGGIDRFRAAEREQLAEERRRLQDVARMHARMFPESENGGAGGRGPEVAQLLSALLGW